MTRLLLSSFWLFLGITSFALAQNATKLDSVLNLIKTTTTDSVKADALNEAAFTYYLKAPDSTLFFGKQSLSLAQKINSGKRISQAYRVIGLGYQIQGQFEKAKLYYDSALMVAQNGKDVESESLVLINIGNLHSNLGEYPEALKAFHRGLEVNELLGFKSNIAAISNNIGIIYQKQGELPKAISYFMQSKELAIETEDRYSEGVALVNLGDSYFAQKSYSEALKSYHASRVIWETLNIPCAWIYSGAGLGATLLALSQPDSAMYYLEKSLTDGRMCNNPEVVVSVLVRLGNAEKKKGKPQNAIRHLTEAYQTAAEKKMRNELKDAAFELSEVYEAVGDPAKALRYYQVFHESKDSLFNQENTRKIASLESEYAMEKLKKEEEAKRKVEAVKQAQLLSKERWIRNSFIIGFLVICLIAFLIYKNFSRKKKANQALRVLNTEINEQKEELQQQSEELKMLNESLSSLNNNLESEVRKRTHELVVKNDELESKNQKLSDYAFFNAHKLRAPVASILGLISIFENETVSEAERQTVIERLKKCTSDLDEVIKSIKEMLEEGE